ncbi:ATP-binding cassette domain-containing protein [Labrys sp. KB_33_2]|uniref:ATP-binding cassette domain-containing protein n=1 Tax=Labrys sp. KB_33_2 TaxID=3237479 RepID=UPI003F90422E
MTDTLLQVEDLVIETKSRTAGGKADGGAAPRQLVHGISFEVGREKVAVVGESGSGKSLTARAIMGLLPTSLTARAAGLRLGETDLADLDTRGWQRLRGRRIGLVLQDPKFSLNPAHRIGRQVEEALLLHGRLPRAERRRKALSMLTQVGLDDPERVYGSLPAELSGGMGQRVMIAAMLIGEPELLIADEPTSALDHVVRDQILELLERLARERGMGLLLISHDLQQVSRFADRVLVMRQGSIVDALPANELAHASHPYTRGLWQARPSAATYGTRLPTPDMPQALLSGYERP